LLLVRGELASALLDRLEVINLLLDPGGVALRELLVPPRLLLGLACR
jgi:hypothetical protein